MNGRSLTAMLLALVLPGAGHFYLGRSRRAIAFFSIVVVVFLYGLLLDGGLYTLAETHGSLLRVLATVGSMGSGILYWAAKAAGPQGVVTSETFEYGLAFTLTAGLMNLLLVIDCFDIAAGRKR